MLLAFLSFRFFIFSIFFFLFFFPLFMFVAFGGGCFSPFPFLQLMVKMCEGLSVCVVVCPYQASLFTPLVTPQAPKSTCPFGLFNPSFSRCEWPF